MRIAIASTRTAASRIDPAVIAALTVAIETTLESSIPEAAMQTVTPPWRAAARSVEAFDDYAAARYAKGRRRRAVGGPRP